MKKSILLWAMMLTIGLSNVFANNEETINQKALSSFKKDFSSAQNVKWETRKEFVKATFTLGEQVMFAYYSHTGELMVVTRNIVSSQLPINLLSNLKREFNNYWISDLFETSSDVGASYYVTLQSADQILVLKSSGNNWETYKREKKTL
jgi:hypothetical protein